MMMFSPLTTPTKRIVKRSLNNARTRRTLRNQIEGQDRKDRLISIAQRFKGLFHNQIIRSLYLEISFINSFEDFQDEDPIYFDSDNNNSGEFPLCVLHPDGSKSKTKAQWKSIIRDMSKQPLKARDFVEKQIASWQSKDWSNFLIPCLGLEKLEHFNLHEFIPIVISQEYLAQAPPSPEI